ncbi:MAG: hypothetical protein ACOCTG_00510 [Bacteroidota bacterium]
MFKALPAVLILALTVSACDSLLGSKQDDTTDEIFDAARTDPTLFREVEYVPLFPFFTIGGDGQPLEAPSDVYIGFDQFIYVTDSRGLHVLDRSGRPASFVSIPGGATSVIQDRTFRVYATARRDTTIGERTWNLPVVLRYDGLTTGSADIGQIIWHPFSDDSRTLNRPDPVSTDEEVEFTGVAVLADGNILVSRRGPVNPVASIINPHNAVMEFNENGLNVQTIRSLSPVTPSLRSAVNPSDILTFVHPPQRQSFSTSRDFIVAQQPPEGEQLQYAVVSIRAVETPEGIEYRTDTDKIQVAGNPDAGESFLYDDFRFERPTDLAFAADGSNYIFVVDGGKDSLFVFTSRGVEGVSPPPGAASSLPVNVSFGGTGDASMEFDNPEGVAYFRRIVYVADTGNNRISRFRLNTDFE